MSANQPRARNNDGARAVFVSEGLQKFVLPERLGAGRFEKIGFAGAHWVAQFVGSLDGRLARPRPASRGIAQ
jgi:hypothetical protein